MKCLWLALHGSARLAVLCDRVRLSPLCPMNAPLLSLGRAPCCVCVMNSHLHALSTPAPHVCLVISTPLPPGQYSRHYLAGLLGSHSLLEATSPPRNRELVIQVYLSCTERSSYPYFNIYSGWRETIIRRWRKHKKNALKRMKCE